MIKNILVLLIICLIPLSGEAANVKYEKKFAKPVKSTVEIRPNYIKQNNHKLIMARTKKRKLTASNNIQRPVNKTYNQVSRFDRQYKISSQRKLTFNGITYYGK